MQNELNESKKRATGEGDSNWIAAMPTQSVLLPALYQQLDTNVGQPLQAGAVHTRYASTGTAPVAAASAGLSPATAANAGGAQ